MKDHKDTLKPWLKRVSVIIPFYNRSSNFKRCIESIVNQSVKDIEIILISCIPEEDVQAILNNDDIEDRRLVVITKPGITPGEACNTGIDMASGDYVCFIDPNDWIEPEMIESLAETAYKQNVDVIRAFIYLHSEYGDIQVHNYFYDRPEILNNRTSDRYLLSEFYLWDPVQFASLFKKQFLIDNEIKFSRMSALGYYDLLFTVLSIKSLTSLYISRSALYHHEVTNDYNKFFGNYGNCESVLGEHLQILERLNRTNDETKLIQLDAVRLLEDIERFLHGLNTTGQRIMLLRRSSPILIKYYPYITDSCYLTKHKLNAFRKYAQHPIMSAFLYRRNVHMKIIRFLLDVKFGKGVSHIRIFRIPVVFVKNNDDYFTFNIIKVPIIRRKIERKRVLEGFIITKRYYSLYVRVAKTIEYPDTVSLFIFGFRIMKKDNEKTKSNLTADDIVYYTAIANAVSDTHKKVFPQFKNTNAGQSIAIFGAGPSMNFAPKVENCKTIACNRSLEFFKQGDPTYYFVHNYHGSKSIFDRILKLNSHVFLGCFIHKEGYVHSSIPEQVRLNENVYKYFFVSGALGSIRAEIEYFPLADFWTVVHPAMHFALYTNADTIYLLGCDTTESGYANKNLLQVRVDIDLMKAGYEKFKEFRDVQYPNTRIVSVNPIGLKGIFEDVYTKEFVEQNPDLDKSKVTIIEGI